VRVLQQVGAVLGGEAVGLPRAAVGRRGRRGRHGGDETEGRGGGGGGEAVAEEARGEHGRRVEGWWEAGYDPAESGARWQCHATRPRTTAAGRASLLYTASGPHCSSTE
jgi:hypothetical protein